MNLRNRLDLLDTLLASNEPLDENIFSSVKGARHFEELLRVALGLHLRRGPGGAEPGHPSRILDLAVEAVRRGRVGASTAVDLRRTLARLADASRSSGLWHPETPLWWEPVVEPSQEEILWQLLNDQWLLPPTHDVLAHLAPDGPGWIHLENLVAPPLLDRLWADGATLDPLALALEPAGVGQNGALSTRRSDAVGYVDGREPDLLRHHPELALLVQGLLERFHRFLNDGLPSVAFPPQRAMLAHYPAPSEGYAPHLDNPGGDHDNGRLFTLVLYLNHPATPCVGGDIALWRASESTSRPPATVLPAHGGSAVLFDARRIPHQVRALEPGPGRWALTLWFNATPQAPLQVQRIPELEPTDALLHVPTLPLGPDTTVFHRFDEPAEGAPGAHRLEAVQPGASPQDRRLGLVSTVYGAGRHLAPWCAHHLDLGIDPLVLIFDRLEEPAERDLAESLEARFGNRLVIWSGQGTAEERWPLLEGAHPAQELEDLQRFSQRHGASYAVAARQTLNASCVLRAAQAGEFGRPVHWLLHLDSDEYLWLQGADRGGATLDEHLAALDAAGVRRVRYLNHELLAPPSPESPRPQFKINPRLARTILGDRGWPQLVRHLAMGQDDPRPYFRAYLNGKSAVAVGAAVAAAGVHGWRLRNGDPQEDGGDDWTVAGPSILHWHFTSRRAFRRKYLAMAHAAENAMAGGITTDTDRPFPPSPIERRAVDTILRHRRNDPRALNDALDALHHQCTHFTDEDIEWLRDAGLLIQPPRGPQSS